MRLFESFCTTVWFCINEDFPRERILFCVCQVGQCTWNYTKCVVQFASVDKERGWTLKQQVKLLADSCCCFTRIKTRT